MSEDWRTRRDDDLRMVSDVADFLLVGHTVIRVEGLPHNEECDGSNVLRLTLDNDSTVDIIGGYGGYTGHSCDEYVETIDVAVVEPEDGAQ